MTSNTKQAQSKPHQKQKCNKREKRRDPEEIRKRSSKRHIYKNETWREKKKEKETQNKAGASAGEDNP